MEVDYKELLKKYIAWVEVCEGVNFITSGSFYHEEDDFTLEERAELIKLTEKHDEK